MDARLKLTPAVVAALALLAASPLLPAAPASAADATDDSVPPECLEPDLSAEDQARCDFIARTPNICMWRDLSDRTQLWCDQKRFADEPHYNVVRLARDGAVRSIHLIETKTGRELLGSYPYGLAFGVPTDDTREARMTVEELDEFLAGRPTPAATGATAPSGFAQGLPIGWNESTGRTSGQCLNYTIQTPSGNVEQASFSSQNAASSTAEQINASVTVSGAVDLLHVSNTTSFSDQWQSSTNSSNQYFNFFSLYTLNSSVPRRNTLTRLGQNAGASFNTLCGNEYLSSVSVGMVATISIAYGSSSASTQTTISDEFKASEGLDSVTAAVSAASSATSSSSYFIFSMIHYGGGTDAASALNDAFAAENSSGEAYYALCAAGNSQGCTQFTSSMGQGASKALDSFDTLVANLGSATQPDLSFFGSFPNGVAGASTPAAVTTPIPTTNTDEVLKPYASQLSEYVRLTNQVGTLNNRAKFLHDLLSGTPFNPDLVDIASYLTRLQDVYLPDRIQLLDDLDACLAATSRNVTSVCEPIIDNQATNAFEYYASDGVNPNFFAQQNTLALQYTGLGISNEATIPRAPLDVVYLDELPPIGGAPIAGEAAFVSFLDREVPAPDVTNGRALTAASANILALTPGDPLSTSNVSTKVRVNPANPSPFNLWAVGEGLEDLIFIVNQFTTISCTPTFAEPCAIDYESSTGTVTEHDQMTGGLF